MTVRPTFSHSLWRTLLSSAVLLGLLAGVVVLTSWPPYRALGADQAVLKISLRHAGVVLGECHTLSADELADLPANMRAPTVCPRERSPVRLAVDVNGRTIIEAEVQPQGLHDDGRSVFYDRRTVPTGPVRIDVRMNDDQRQPAFTHHATYETVLAPGRALIVDFDESAGSFVFL